MVKVLLMKVDRPKRENGQNCGFSPKIWESIYFRAFIFIGGSIYVQSGVGYRQHRLYPKRLDAKVSNQRCTTGIGLGRRDFLGWGRYPT